ncbi:MAG: TIGR03086 family protein [Acidimicrobiales bacterium]|nr:TIGR03086 family protein [Acidimicrobiales bacterium]
MTQIEEVAVAEPTLYQLVDRALADVDGIVAAVSPGDFGRPTPCAEFDVRALLGHFVGGLRSFAELGEGGEMRFDLDPDLDRESAVDEYRAAAARIRAAWADPAMAGRMFAAPWGESPGSQILGFMLLEVVTHGWDLAHALLLERTVDAELAEAALAGAQASMDESARVPGLFGPEVAIAADAPAPDRLAAFLGRTP